jgi:hypothetical protein
MSHQPLVSQQVPSGFWIFTALIDQTYSALSFFETMPSRPSLQTALNIFYAVAFGVFDVLNAASSLPRRSLKMIAPSGGHTSCQMGYRFVSSN